MGRITTIIVDDHAAFRRTLRKVLQTMDNVEVVGEAADGIEAIELVLQKRPQLVLMDILMPKLSGADCCRAIKQDNPNMWVVLYSGDSIEVDMAKSQKSADFCLVKECLFDELPAWIEARAAGLDASQPNQKQSVNNDQ